ncbi:TonB-dependent siderophore receptor [Cellvibrio japonicus]|uniref:TonB-dependent receptor protein n=1 Tax=Cellvibrio japonicus (strain Ueda107) TaxID=498211 RepID=B3PJT8_CELJU|nr:TonB-dependent siderophore receptor [Cellvibrio japonicus]ACE83959.1 TonB-dependent receptor protein [Cellvibrio japonicus Ueda107]QEI12721.1 TonB-dependent siderophore receptor [Cellvibrio japonicus]QEI16295.1 TonB-dependent siderophore receptor [Cellvibrio japonicus]QEI19873.1 TonB-dependent siderophore receptor [Cellvibrio japonicus]
MRQQSHGRLQQFHLPMRVLRNTSFSLLLAGVSASPLSLADTVTEDSQAAGKKPEAAARLKTVKVNATATDGGVDNGYRTETVSGVGAWQGRSLQDTPYSLNVYSEELIENLQATTPDQVYRVNPTTQLVRAQHENNQPRIMMRGFSVQRSYRDGVPDDQYNHSATMEDTARIEVLNGLSGFLYGANNVGGVTNYVTKRSTDERVNQLTLSSLGGDSWYTHGDFGGKFDSEGKYGYRVNLVEQGGDGAIKNQEIEKTFYSLAFDGYLFDDFWVQIHGMDYTYDVNGSQTYWYFASGVKRPSADSIDNDISWGQPWTNRWYDYNRYGSNVKWQISERVALRAAYIDNRGTRGSESTSNTITSAGTYNQQISGVYAPGLDTLLSEQKDSGAAAYLDVLFETGAVEHKLTAGYQYNDSFQYRYQNQNGVATNAAPINLSGLSMSSPTYIPHPTNVAPVNRGVLILSSNTEYRNLVIGDDITFNEQWSALLGAAYTSITQKTGTGYDESALTPSVSILFKPVETLTTYISYIEALEAGVVVPQYYNNNQSVTVVNYPGVFDPLTSKQVEVGVKAKVSQLALDAAVFRIEKGLQYYVMIDPANVRFVQDGQQVHQGIELTAIGNLTDNLNIIGGFTWLDAQVEEQNENPALEGKTPVDVAERIMKVRFEYAAPFVPNLNLSASASYNGSSYGNTMNTDKVPGYTLFDIGARYQMDVAKKLVTFRADLHNLTNEHYWNGFNGTRIGDPRTLMVSATVEF